MVAYYQLVLFILFMPTPLPAYILILMASDMDYTFKGTPNNALNCKYISTPQLDHPVFDSLINFNVIVVAQRIKLRA